MSKPSLLILMLLGFAVGVLGSPELAWSDSAPHARHYHARAAKVVQSRTAVTAKAKAAQGAVKAKAAQIAESHPEKCALCKKNVSVWDQAFDRAMDSRFTREHALFDTGLSAGVMDMGLTLSQLDKVRNHGFAEWVHVLGRDGSSSLEMLIGRFRLFGQTFLEVQGPGLSRSAEGKIGFRVAGIGLTGDVNEGRSIKALSYTLEGKLTSRGTKRMFAYASPELMRHTALRVGHNVAGEALRAMVPVLSVGLAINSIKVAYKLYQSPTATKREKRLASMHLAADIIRVVNPQIGMLANAVIIAGNSAFELRRLFRWKRDVARVSMATP